MKRRQFLMNAAAGVAGLSVAPRGWAQAVAQQRKQDRIAIMTLNFQSILRVPDVQPSAERTLEVMDIAEMLADTYGVHNVEFQHYHIPDTDPAYLRSLRERFARSNSRITQINLEFGNLNMSETSQRNRNMAVDLTKAWVDHAVTLGAPRVMANQGGLDEDVKHLAIPIYKRMVDYGKSKNVRVSLETRGNPRTQQTPEQQAAAAAARAAGQPTPFIPNLTQSGRQAWELLAEVVDAAEGYTNVDMGGSRARNQQELHASLRRHHARNAGGIHTRVNPNWDLATTIRFLEGELGYRGHYTIETNGHAGTKQVYDIVMATLPGQS